MWILTNRFHVAVRLFSNRSQMTSKCGKNKKVAHEAQVRCNFHCVIGISGILRYKTLEIFSACTVLSHGSIMLPPQPRVFARLAGLQLILIMRFIQEIIKVREWIPHIGPQTRVIHLNLFLDMVPSSSANFTRALRVQSRRLYTQGHAKLPET